MSDLKRGFMDRRQRGGPEEVLGLDHVDSAHVPRRLLPKNENKRKGKSTQCRIEGLDRVQDCFMLLVEFGLQAAPS